MKLTKIATAIAVAFALNAIPAGAVTASSLDGVYRTTWTESQLIAAGTSHEYAHGNQGVLTWTLQHGTFTLDFGTPPDCLGTYAVSGSILSATLTTQCHGFFVARWSLGGGLLRLHVTRTDDPMDEPVFWGGKPWKKIG